MKHIKIYEEFNPKLDIGTYVICDEETSNNMIGLEFKNFLKNNVGQIVNYNNEEFPYVVKYENIPVILLDRFDEVSNSKGIIYKDRRVMRENEIIHYSKNEEELKAILKFNI